ncbi:MAG: hypothetical protein J6T30_04170, partial [Bacteroidales bacterium]|nr:hypothetical protein [Bacteroidales bacterium]
MSIWWKKTIGIFTLFLLFAINANSQDSDAYTLHFDTQRDGISVSSNGYDISILYSIQQLSFRHITSDNGEYVKISVPNHISTTTPGEPELPIYSSLIVIPDDGNYSINISDIRYEEFLLDEYGITYPIYPSQEETTKSSIQSSENIYINKTSYLSDGFLEHDTVAIDIVGKVRGTTMATMTISPIFYNPKRNSLCVITNMDIEISFSGGASQPSEISAISDVLKRAAINYNANEVVPEYTETPLRMVILTDTTLSEALRPFIQWKHQKGIETILLFKGDVSVGTTDTEMRNALANLYNSNLKPDYLLIVGNTDIIPNYSASSFITDLYYGEYDGGDDYIPDVLIGRIPASNAKEVVDVTSKIIQYEKMEFPDNGTYLRDALVFAGVDATYEDFMNGHINYAINNYLTNENNINEHHSYVGESQKDSILNIINNGVSF